MKTYHRPDGVVGCGFYGEFGGLWQHSIAWPDQSAARMRHEDLEERKIAVKDLAVVPFSERAAIEKVNVNKNGDSMIVEDIYVGPPVDADPYTTNDLPPPADPPAFEDPAHFDPSLSEAENIRIALAMMPGETNKGIIEVLNRHGVNVSSSQVTRERKSLAKAEATEETASE
jgi:hypothetical protein